MAGVLEPVYLHRFTGPVSLADFGAGASGFRWNRGVNDRSSETKKLALRPGETEKNCRGNIMFPSNVSCLTTSANMHVEDSQCFRVVHLGKPCVVINVFFRW